MRAILKNKKYVFIVIHRKASGKHYKYHQYLRYYGWFLYPCEATFGDMVSSSVRQSIHTRLTLKAFGNGIS